MFAIRCHIDRVLYVLGIMILTVSSVTAVASARGDFDHDGKADFAVFRPASGTWYTQSSEENGAMAAFRWGVSTDVLVPADYDGDGVIDKAVWRPETGTWYICHSSDDSLITMQWGVTTKHLYGGLPDVPVPADFDADGRADIAVWRPDTGQWFIRYSSAGYDFNKSMVYKWGKLGDVPVQADYDGDGKADIGVFRSADSRWYIIHSSTGNWFVRHYGIAGDDLLVPADYTGDGKADLAVYRSGTWFVLDSRSGQMEPFVMGFADATPAPADYDGDGQTDFAVYRKGTWYVYESSEPKLRSFKFGREEDVPVHSVAAKLSVVAVP